MNRRNYIVIVAALILGLLATVAQAQRPCVKCGRVHGNIQAPTPPRAVASPPRFANEGLEVLNRQRASRGLGPLVHDPGMMSGALTKCQRAVQIGRWGHQGGSLSQFGANKEGVGMSSGSKSFNSCYAYSAPAGTPAGAALLQARNGSWYSVLLIRHNGYLPSGSSGPGRFLFRR